MTPPGTAVRPGRDKPSPIRLLFFGLLLVLALYAFSQSAYFRVATVRITGIERLTAAEIQTATGLQPGTNYWKVDVRAAARKLETLLRVRGARVTRVFPNGVTVEIQERQAVALIPYRDTFLEVDATGVVLSFVDDIYTARFPLITGADADKPSVGQAVRGGAGIDRGLLAASLLRRHEVPGISEIHLGVDPKSGQVSELMLYTTEGAAVYLAGSGPPRSTTGAGNPPGGGAEVPSITYIDPVQLTSDVLAARIEELKAILQDVRSSGERAAYIDLRFDGRPVVKLKPAE